MAERKKKPRWINWKVRDLSEAVYRTRLGPADVASMIAKDGDSGEKLRGRAGSYDTLTCAYLEALGLADDHKSL